MKIKFNHAGILLMGFACLWAPAGRAATTWYVATNGTGEGVNGWADATNSLPGAVAASIAGDTVLVSNGSYQLSAQLTVNKAVTLQSLAGWGETEIRGDFPNTVFRCMLISAAATVDGFTIANGWQNVATDGAAGIYISAGTLRNCRVTGNYLQTPSDNIQRGGAGIYMSGSAVVSNCLVDGNVLSNMSTHSCSGGGGVFMYSDNAWLADSVVYNNISTNSSTPANGRGGGVAFRKGNITGCLIVSNASSGAGGGVHLNYAAVLISDTTNSHNYSASDGGGLYAGSLSPSSLCVLTNVCFKNNTAKSSGGGVFMAQMSSFRNCRFTDNQASNYAGGAYVSYIASFDTCEFRSNRALGGYGGGLFLKSNTGVVTHCLFESNSVTGATVNGGAVYVDATVVGPWLVENCTMRGNYLTDPTRAYGGGLCIAGSGVTLRNCLIYNNSAVSAGALYGGRGGGIQVNYPLTNIIESCTIVSNYATTTGAGIHFSSDGADTLRNSIVYNNLNQSGAADIFIGNDNRKTNLVYTCTPDADETWGAGCVAAAPQFADPSAGNYRLNAGSSAINSGTNMPWMMLDFDLDGHVRMDRFSRRVDMGCYEYLFNGAFFIVK